MPATSHLPDSKAARQSQVGISLQSDVEDARRVPFAFSNRREQRQSDWNAGHHIGVNRSGSDQEDVEGSGQMVPRWFTVLNFPPLQPIISV